MKAGCFIIDLSRCTGCGACRIACKDRADLPDGTELVRIEVDETGAFPHARVIFRVVHCFHCQEPPCVDVCPVDALEQTTEGWVQIDPDKCTCCGACVNSCPFGAIELTPDGKPVKCDGCPGEIAAGRSPVCVRACPMRALGYESPEGPLPTNRFLDEEFPGEGAGPRVRFLRRLSSPDDKVARVD